MKGTVPTALIPLWPGLSLLCTLPCLNPNTEKEVKKWLASFCVVAVGSVVAGAKALPMMHHHGRELVKEVLRAGRAGGAGAAGTGVGHGFGWGFSAAVGLHVEELIEADVDSNLFPVVPPRPPEDQSEGREKAEGWSSKNSWRLLVFLLESRP